MKRSSIAVSILIPICLLLWIGNTAVNLITGTRSARLVDDLAEQIAAEAVSHYAYQLKADGDQAFRIAHSTAPLLKRFSKLGGGREAVLEAFVELMEEHPSIQGIWTVWEPNRFDGMDSRYRNQEYHDATGRMIPYVYRSGNQIVTEALVGYEGGELDYYTGAKEAGRTFYSDPYLYHSGSGELMLYSISVPILENGTVVGAVGVNVDVNELNERYNSIAIMETGRLLTLNPRGISVTSPNSSRLFQHYTQAWDVPLAEHIETILVQGGSYQSSRLSVTFQSEAMLNYQGVKIGDDEGYWVVCSAVPFSTARNASHRIILFTSFLHLLMILLVAGCIIFLVRRRLRDLGGLTHAALALAEGKLDHIDLPAPVEGETKNEVVLLQRAFSSMIKTSRSQVEAIQQIAEGDLTVEIQPKSWEDLLNVALQEMLLADNQTFHQIRQSADTVTAGANQIAESSLMQAQAIMEQSSAVEELESSMVQIAARAAESEEMVLSAAGFAESIRTVANRSAGKIDMAARSVNEINESSNNIYSVITIMDNISFDLNRLAIEITGVAARMGPEFPDLEHLADSVRTLAEKGNVSARDTALIVTEAIKRIEVGLRIFHETAGIMGEIIADVNQNSDLLVKINEACRSQAASIRQIEIGIREISAATQRTSSAAEESASTSEELNGQSELLRHLVSQFKLKEEVRATQEALLSEVVSTDSAEDVHPEEKYDIGEEIRY